ncbi:MAG: nucleotide-binding protein [Kiritimatiellae bacterium]|jgi:predicted nucleotide-binding protein|nr:nucleotide-binding protein [Kiritimatiellia bacterium]
MKKVFSKDKAITKVQTQIDQIDALSKKRKGNPDFKKWIRDTQVAIEYIFGEESRHITDFNKIRYCLGAFTNHTPESRFQQAYVDGLNHAEGILKSMIEEIAEYWNDNEIDTDKNSEGSQIDDPVSNNKVFVVHGQDAGTKETVARFLSQIGLDPIILHEQASQGNTIIEKFEQYADVSYAIALLTPDDIGGPVAETENLTPRARQNVIFEFGYFIGKLGRNKVLGLLREGVEIPSDYSGVVYIPIDSGGAWKLFLVKELKSSGFDIDANKAL